MKAGGEFGCSTLLFLLWGDVGAGFVMVVVVVELVVLMVVVKIFGRAWREERTHFD